MGSGGASLVHVTVLFDKCDEVSTTDREHNRTNKNMI